MICPACKQQCPEQAAFCGYCGHALSRGGNGFRSDWASTVVDEELAKRVAQASGAAESRTTPEAPKIDAKTDPWKHGTSAQSAPQQPEAKAKGGSGEGRDGSTRPTPQKLKLDGSTDPWQGKREELHAARGASGTGWPERQNPLHDTVPNFAVRTVPNFTVPTVSAPADVLAAVVAQSRDRDPDTEGDTAEPAAAQGPQAAKQAPQAAKQAPQAAKQTPQAAKQAPNPAIAATVAVDDGATSATMAAGPEPSTASGTLDSDQAHAATAAMPAAQAPAPQAGPADLETTKTDPAGQGGASADPAQKAAASTAQDAAASADPAQDAAPSTDSTEALSEGATAAGKRKDAKPRPKRVTGALPGRRLIRLMMIAFGLLMIGSFALPWIVAGGLPSDIGGALGQLGFAGLYPLAGAVLLLLAALIPLPYSLRALIAAVVSLVALGITASAAAIDWRPVLQLGLLVLLPAALLHRARHRGSILSRMLVILAVGGLLATLLVPAGGSLPLMGMLSAAQTGGSFHSYAQQVYPIVLLPLCALCLFTVVLGRRRSGFSRLWAFLLLLVLPVQVWLGVAVSVYTVSEAFQSQLTTLSQGLITFALLTLGAYGLSQLFWKVSGAGKATRAGDPDAIETTAEVALPLVAKTGPPLRPANSVGS
jgi:hypothetical protein